MLFQTNFPILKHYPFNNNVSIKQPIHVAEPKSIKRTMWVLLRITKLMVESVCAHPINWTPLKKNNRQIKSNHIN